MPSLHEVQRSFLLVVLSHENAQSLLDGVVDAQPGRLRRLAVYRGTVFHNLREALRAVFPVVHKLVGQEFFDYAADRHIDGTPSHSGNIHDYGGGFADFLAGFAPAATLPYLPDMARLEWSIHESFHAEDAPALDLARLAQVAPEHRGDLAFRLHPACRLLASPYPVHAIWQANQQEEMPELRLDAGGAALLVRRRDFTTELLPLRAGEYCLLRHLAAGRRFADALAAALDAQPGFDAATFLLRHVQEGTLTDYLCTHR